MPTNPSYTFHSTHLQNFVNHVEFYEYFSPPECDAIIKMGLSSETKIAGITGENVTDEKYRKSQVGWIECLYDNAWLWHKMAELSQKANESHYCMKLLGFRECCQFTIYKEGGSHYNWHMDFGNGKMSQRKLSICVQLSDPDTYDGGDLELFYAADPVVAHRGRGTSVVFPSYTMHRVTPVTRGIRYSLVLWVSGHEPYH